MGITKIHSAIMIAATVLLCANTVHSADNTHESEQVLANRVALQRLHAAVRVGDPDAVIAALATGVDINRSSALEIAILMERSDIIDLLIARGADVNQPGPSGELPLTIAVRRGKPELLQRMLDRGADINLPDRHGLSAQEHAERLGRSDAVDLLRRHGARDPGPGIE